MMLLTQDEMVELVESSASEREALQERMKRVRGGQPVVFEGQNVTTIMDNGKAIGAFTWFYSKGDKTLCVTNGASLDNGELVFPKAMRAFQMLAKQIGATAIETVSSRGALIDCYRNVGWTVEGVVLRKELPIVL